MPEHEGSPRQSVWIQLAERLDPGRYCPLPRADVEVFQLDGSAGDVMLRNPTGAAYLRLTERQYRVVRAMDGTHSVRDLLRIRFEDEGILELAGIGALVASLRAGGFLTAGSEDSYARLRRYVPRRADLAAWLYMARYRFGRAWRPAALERALTAICALLGLLFRPTIVRVACLALALAGLALPLAASLTAMRGVGTPAGRDVLIVVLLAWVVVNACALAGATAGAALRRPPRRAGVRLWAGIPLLWADAREAIANGPRGARFAWCAGPVAVLAAAAVAWLGWPANDDACSLSLILAGLGILALAPQRVLGQGELAAHAWEAARTYAPSGPWPGSVPLLRLRSLAPEKRRAALRFDKLYVAWASAAALWVAAAVRADLARLPAALWHAASPPQAALLAIVIACVLLSGAIQIAARLLEPNRPSGKPLFTPRGRYNSRHLRRRLAVMRQCDVLRDLTPAQMLALASSASEVRFPRGMDAVVQGEVGDEFYIVMDGMADVIDEGGPTLLGHLGRGDSFGKYAMLYHALRAATVRAAVDLTLLRIERPAFDAYLAPRLLREDELSALSEEREFLAAVPALAPLGARALDLLLPRLLKESYEPGEVIIKQGDQGEHFYIVRNGTAEVLDETTTPPRRLAVLGNGAYFGEIALLLDSPRVATVQALTEVTVWSLSRADFDLVLGRYFGLSDTFTTTSHKRLEMNRARSA